MKQRIAPGNRNAETEKRDSESGGEVLAHQPTGLDGRPHSEDRDDDEEKTGSTDADVLSPGAVALSGSGRSAMRAIARGSSMPLTASVAAAAK